VIPFHILTGFLGSGKTTLLSALLQSPSAANTAVIVNEVGELALDHHLLERVDEDVVALPSGCICCSVRGELMRAVERVLAARPQRIVLETSGAADPAPVLHSLASDPEFGRRAHIAGVIAVADASRLDELIETQPEVARQLEFADRVVLSKVDLVPERVAAARARLATAAPGCEVREAIAGRVDPEWLFARGSLGRIRDPGDAHAWLHHGGNGEALRTRSVDLPAPARIDLLQLWLRFVTQWDGHRLLRVKTLVECADTGDVFALHSAGHAVSPPQRLAVRPWGLRGVRLVLVERGLSERVLQLALTALRDAAAATLAGKAPPTSRRRPPTALDASP